MGTSGFNLHPDELHSSGDTLTSFGSQVSKSGQSLQQIGSDLVSHASSDKSGVGKIIANSMGRASEVAGKVFSEGGRVAGAAGQRLHAGMSAHEDNESSIAKAFDGAGDKDKSVPKPHSSSGGGNSGEGKGSGHPTPDKPPTPHDEGAGSGGGTPSSSTGESGYQGPPKIKDSNGDPHENSTSSSETCTGGDPIDVATGRMISYHQDVELAGVLALVVGRTHRSDYRLGRWFGSSWASTLDQRLEIEDDGVHFAVDDGRLLSFPLPVDEGAVLPVAGARWLLRRDTSGRYRIIDPATELAYHFAPVTDPRVLPLVAIVDGDGNRIDVDHDARGTLIALRHSGGYHVAVDTADGLITALRLLDAEHPDGIPLAGYAYDEQRRLVGVVNATGGIKHFRYDAEGRIVRWETDGEEWYSFGYDSAGRCVRGQGAGGNLDVTMAYDRDNLVTSVTNSLGNTTRYQLDAHYQVVAEIDPLGNATSYEWDEEDRLVARANALGQTTRYEHDAAGNVTAITWPDGARTVAEYNEWGRRTAMVAEDGGVWRFEFDRAGKLTREIDPIGAPTAYAYDDRGNVAAVTDALGGVTRYQRNAAGLPIAVTDPLGATTRYDYDPFGHVSSITDPLGGVTRLSWTASGELRERVTPDGTVRRRGYDGHGRNTETVDANGHLTRTEFGGFDLPVAEVGADGSRLSYTYDTELRLTSITNEHGLVWRYEYDAADNLVRETDYNGRVQRYEHDAAGRMIRRTSGSGEVVTFERDAQGRTVRRTTREGTTAFGYDPTGRMVFAGNADAEVVIGYDQLGRKISESVNGRVTRFEHDGLGRPTKLIRPSGAESTWEYDAASHPLALHTAGRTLRLHYDVAGRPVRRELGRLTVHQAWSPEHRLTTQLIASGDQQVQRREYGYQPDGALSAVNDSHSGARRLTLDTEGRVQAIQGERWQERYAYDAAGNITFAGWPTAGPAAAVGPRQYHGTLLVGAGELSYRHDADGRTVARQRRGANGAPETWQYQWNSDNQLVGVTTPDGTRWRYRYDALGRRIAKEQLAANGQVRERVDFTWDGADLVEQVHAGAGRRPFALAWDWEPGRDAPVSQREWPLGEDPAARTVDERFFAIVTDLVGSPTELVDETGNVAWRGQASLWGTMFAQTGPAYTPLRFPGQYHDAETGLHYNMYRYYDPETGRYLSHDPLGLDAASDSFAYVRNPTGWIDPLGLMPTKCAKGAPTAGPSSGGPSGSGSGSGSSKKRKRQDDDDDDDPKGLGKLEPGADATSVPPKPKRVRGSDPNGTHGDKTQEQTRLTKAYQDKSGQDKKVSGKTHESEHVAGYDVLIRKWKQGGLETKRGKGEEEKYVEDGAPAYQEREPLHAVHDGTGAQFSGGKKGNTVPGFSQNDKDNKFDPNAQNTYRHDQFNALTDPAQDGKNQISNAFQLNQLGYAHIKNDAGEHPFQEKFDASDKSDAAVEQRQSNDSYNHMVDNLHKSGQGVAYGDVMKDASGNYTVKGMSRTEPLDGYGAAEIELGRKAAQTGNWPTQDEIDTTLKKYGVDPKAKDDDAMDVDG